MATPVGYIRLQRSISETPILKHPTALMVFINLAIRAEWEEREAQYNGVREMLQTGEVLTSIREICLWTRLKKGQVERSLAFLNKHGATRTQPGNRATRISIVEYASFGPIQDEGEAAGGTTVPILKEKEVIYTPHGETTDLTENDGSKLSVTSSLTVRSKEKASEPPSATPSPDPSPTAPNPPKKLTPIQEVVEYYREATGSGFRTAAALDAFFKRHVKAAKSILEVSDGVAGAKRAIDYMVRWSDSSGLNWNLSTVYRAIVDPHAFKIRENEDDHYRSMERL